MSRQNVELVRRVNEAYERGDFAAVYAAYDPNIEWLVGRVAGASLGFDPVYSSVEGVRRFFREWLEGWQVVSFEFEEYIDAGDRVTGESSRAWSSSRAAKRLSSMSACAVSRRPRRRCADAR